MTRVRARWRWSVVVCGVAVLCCLPVLASALPVSVPQTTPAQLRDRIVASSSESYAGYAESNATFGLPSLQGLQSLTALLDGVTRMRVWQAAPNWWRVDVLSDVAERDQYQLGSVGYVWDSNSQLLTRVDGRPMFRLPQPDDLVPPSLAARLLREAGADAKFSMLPPQRVAGQSAAGLRVVPADPASTIGQVDIWANPDSGLPLLVQILARGTAVPALETQFLQVSSWQPDAGVLTPQHGPGAGYTVTTANDFTGVLRDLYPEFLPLRLAGRMRQPVLWQYGGIGVYGGGLATFAVLAFSGSTGFNLLNDAQSDGATPFSAPGGDGVLASAPLINLIIVHRSYSQVTFLLAGLVNKQVLEQAAADLVAPS
jgi:hypothetical protein